MKEKKVQQTRENEVIIKTLDPSQMMGLYIKKTVCKKWTEDFIDEDTNETVSIERSVILHKAGTYVDQKTQQEINFDIIEGSITEPVELSNQSRTGLYNEMYGLRPWLAKVKYNDKAHKFLLKAKNIEHCIDIIRDYMETRVSGVFSILQIGTSDNAVFIDDEITHLTETDLDKMYQEGSISFNCYCDALDNTAKDNHPDEDNRTYWSMNYSLEWKTKVQSSEEYENNLFIVHSVNADMATKAILRYLTMQDHEECDAATRRKDGEKVYTLHLQEAKQLPIHAIIPFEYTEANMPKKEEED